MKFDRYEDCKELVGAMNACVRGGDVDGVRNLIEQHPGLLHVKFYCYGQHGLMTFAASFGDTCMCGLLLELGADVNESCCLNNSPLHEAAEDGDLATVEWLLAHGAAPDGTPDHITTPLMDAVVSGHAEVAKLLIQHGADIHRLHGRMHQTPLDLAMKWGRADIEELLRSKGAVSTFDEKDFSKEYGGPILNYIHHGFGRVLPVSLTSIIPGTHVTQRIALVNKGNNKLLFTLGLFDAHQPMLELFLVLPAAWNMLDASSRNQFPTALLLALADQVVNGLHINEGHLVLADDPSYAKLAWPPSIGGFQITNCNWGTKGDEAPPIPAEDTVHLWTLVPIKRTKAGLTRHAVEKNRDAGWMKLTLDPGKA